MQPLLRQSKRPIQDSIRRIKPSKPNRHFSSRSLTRTSTCIECQFRLQRRLFADDTKSKPLPTPASSSPQTNNDLSQSSFPDSELPSASDSRRSATSKRLSEVMDHLQGNIFLASQRLNDLTGYSGIEALKKSIRDLETQLENCQNSVRSARQNYKQTVADRAASQREVTTLLARKDTWSPTDLERFTNLYRSDHGNEQAVQEAATRLAEAERIAEQAASKLSTSILSRYHEEQIWSDKIRRMSTWGTWGLMGVNVFIFLVFQFGFEPWRRRRLVNGFEEKVQEALWREKGRIAQVREGGEGGRLEKENVDVDVDVRRLDAVVAAGAQELELELETGVDGDGRVPACDALAAVINKEATEEAEYHDLEQKLPYPSGLGHPSWFDVWQANLLDLFSDRIVSLRKQDVTVIALEGVASGAALVSLITFLIIRQS